MTDVQFEKFLELMQAQTEAINNLNATLSTEVETLKKLKDVSLLGTALNLCKTRSTENVPLQEEGGLAGAIEDIGKFLESAKTPENWKDSVTNEIYIKTFSGKPLKVDEI